MQSPDAHVDPDRSSPRTLARVALTGPAGTYLTVMCRGCADEWEAGASARGARVLRRPFGATGGRCEFCTAAGAPDAAGLE